jgi:hypothetical protein
MIRFQSMLRTIEQMYVDLLAEVAQVKMIHPPAPCEASTAPECIVKLRVNTPDDLDQTKALFRKRAQFIDAMNQQFDELLTLKRMGRSTPIAQ